MAFTFKHGDRVLDAYTIQRGVGRGGFGEVYYAISDGGREVAIKFLRDNPHVELRGVNHCINLKSPHLVSIFDVRKSPAGEYFIIMEYISGPSLRDLLVAEPGGLGVQKAAFFLREIGKGLAYLHDRGIVHRDLKPGNIFFDDGYVKIGDYGLSKFISVSRHSAQTASVGTVHYMAPEVGSGQYTRSIDVYALGVILYEMLLGRVPFEGSSMGEVLMKHLTAQPEVDALPQPFAAVIRKALAKDPKDRYQTVHEMMQDVFDVQEVQQSLAGFHPELSLSGAARAGAFFAEGSDFPQPSPNPPPRAFGPASPPPPRQPAEGVPITRRERFQRMMLSGLMAIGMSFLSGLFGAIVTEFNNDELPPSAGLMAFAGAGGLLLGRKVLGWLGTAAQPVWARRVVLLLCAGFPMLLGSIPMLSDGRQDQTGGAMLLSLLAAVLLWDWRSTIGYGASGALNVSDAFRKGFGTFALAAPLTGVIGGEPEGMFTCGFIALAMSLMLQAAGWWLQPRAAALPVPGTGAAAAPPPPPAPLGRPASPAPPGKPASPIEARVSAMVERWTESMLRLRKPAAAAIPYAIPVEPPDAAAAPASEAPVAPPRSGFARAFWSIVSFALLVAAIVCIVVLASMGHRLSTPQMPVILLTGSLIWALFALSKTTQRRRIGFWRETMRPFLMAAFATTVATSITVIAKPPVQSYRLTRVQPLGAYARMVTPDASCRAEGVRRGMIPVLVFSSLGLVTMTLARGRRRQARPFLITDSSVGGTPAPPRDRCC